MRPLLQEDLEFIRAKTESLWEPLRGEHLFITGGTGFFGRWLVESFLDINQQLNLNAEVTVLSRNPQQFQQEMPHLKNHPALKWLKGDVQSFKFPDQTFSHIIHAATEASQTLNESNPLAMMDTIVTGTRRTLAFAKECGASRFLLTSSGGIYGKQPPDLSHIPETYLGSPDPMALDAAYGESKRIAELLCASYYRQYRIETVIARCFAFVGPHLPLDKHFAVGNFLKNALEKTPIEIQGDGTPYRSYLYAADLTIWLWTLLFEGKPCHPYNVGSEEALSIKEIAEAVAAQTSPPLPIYIAKTPQPGQRPSRYIPNTQRAQQELGLKQQVSFPEALEKTLTWGNKFPLTEEALPLSGKTKLPLN